MRPERFPFQINLQALLATLCTVLLLGHALPANAQSAPSWSLVDPNGQRLAAIAVDEPSSTAPPSLKLRLNGQLLRRSVAKQTPVLLVDGSGQTRSLVHIAEVTELDRKPAP
jgi:hypothetical protein